MKMITDFINKSYQGFNDRQQFGRHIQMLDWYDLVSLTRPPIVMAIPWARQQI